jgi:hypothetical protein
MCSPGVKLFQHVLCFDAVIFVLLPYVLHDYKIDIFTLFYGQRMRPNPVSTLCMYSVVA